jgi:voltage-gated potassium channel Kch
MAAGLPGATVVAPTPTADEHGVMSSVSRAFVRFQKNPSSVRYAAAAIIATIVVLVVAGAVLVRLFASDEYPNFGEAIWFTLQTVTTVGYGDNTPASGSGRFVASFVMLVAIGLTTVITAVITSMFIRSVSREHEEDAERVVMESLARIEATLAAAQERLDRIERVAAEPKDVSAGD